MRHLVLIDSRLPDVEGLKSGIYVETTDYLVFNYYEDTIDSLKTKIKSIGESFDTVAIAQHNYKNATFVFLNKSETCKLHETQIKVEEDPDPTHIITHPDGTTHRASIVTEGPYQPLQELDPQLLTWSHFTEFLQWLTQSCSTNTIDLLACEIWSDTNWKYFIDTMRSRGIYIRASANDTGSQPGDYILESDNVNMIGLYFTPEILGWHYNLVTPSADTTLSTIQMVGTRYSTGSDYLFKTLPTTNYSTVSASGDYTVGLTPNLTNSVFTNQSVTLHMRLKLEPTYAYANIFGSSQSRLHASTSSAGQMLMQLGNPSTQVALSWRTQSGFGLDWGILNDATFANFLTFNHTSIYDFFIILDYVSSTSGNRILSIYKDGTPVIQDLYGWMWNSNHYNPSSTILNAYTGFGIDIYGADGWDPVSVYKWGVYTSRVSITDQVAIVAQASGPAASAPSAPTISSITASGNGQVSVSFTAPANNGSTITTYKYSLNGGSYVNVSSAAIPVVITGLTAGQTYSITIKATNGVGDSVASSAYTSPTVATTADAPTISSITTGLKQLVVAFTAPANTGYTSITDYKYSLNGGAYVSMGTTTSPYTITSLVGGTSYTVAIKATNIAGDSVASTTSAGYIPYDVPAAPTISSLQPGNQQVAINFSLNSANGSPITSVLYSIDNGSTYVDAQTTVSPIVVNTGLTDNQTVSVIIKAVNAGGNSTGSAMVSATTYGVPNSPTVSSRTDSYGQTTLNFGTTTSNGYMISGYKYSMDGGATYTSFDAPATSVLISNLTHGTAYSVKLIATNSKGDSPASTYSFTLPTLVPSTPAVSLAFTSRTTYVATITPPTYTGGASITGYKASVNGGSYTSVTVDASTNTVSFTGSYGSSYYVAIKATNSVGDSTASTVSNTVTVPAQSPEAPVITSTSANNTSSTSGTNGQVLVYFTAPNNGGATITKYRYALNGGSLVDATGVTSPITLSGLTPSTAYSIQLAAVNSAGTSALSSASSITPTFVPANPAITVDASNQSLIVSFTIASNGGASVSALSYSTNGGSSFTNTTSVNSPLTISGLTNGNAYSVILRATNSNGTSGYSNTVSATPVAPPAAPSISVTAGLNCLRVSVTPGSTNGSAITKYQYSIDNGTTFTDVSVNSSFNTSYLVENASASVTVRAVNALGAGTASSPASATPYSYPQAPTITDVSNNNGSSTITFTTGNSNGLSITYYKYSFDNGATYTNISPASNFTSPYVFSGLTNGTTYNVKLWAVSSAGPSATPASFQLVPFGLPPTPVITGISLDNGSATITASASGNGLPIVGIYYSYDSVNYIQHANTAFPIDLSGLTNGTSYSVSVKVANSMGLSAASVPVAFIPYVAQDAPGAPTIDSIVSADSSLLVHYTPGENTGAPITGYKYTLDGVSYAWCMNTSNPLVIPGLVNGDTYTVSIRAFGSGLSPLSNSVSGIPMGFPTTPVIGATSVGIGAVYSTFTADLKGYAYTDCLYQYKLVYSSPDSPIVSDWLPLTEDNSFDVSGLTNGTTYSLSVRLTTIDLSNTTVTSYSAPLSVKPGDTPDAPYIDVVTPGDKCMTLEITNGDTYGSNVIGYKYSLDDGAHYYWVPSVISQATSFTIPGLTNGTVYSIKIKVVSDFGDSVASNTVSNISPVGNISRPIIVKTTPSDTKIDVQFVELETNGYSITGHKYSTDGGETFSTITATDGEMSITGLTNGSSYDVAIQTVTSIGPSTTSNIVYSLTPATTPSAPTITGVTVSTGAASVAFTAGASGGYPITGYKYSLNNGPYTFASETTSPISISGLTNGTSYTVKLCAITDYGTSAASSASSAFTPASLPDKPYILRVDASNSSLVVSFVNGNLNGGTISCYEYSIDGGATYSTASVSAYKYTISGLTNGFAYSVTMRCVTNVGTSLSSTSNDNNIPFTLPAPPTILSVTATSGAASVAFLAGASNGYPITSYKYSLNGGAYTIASGITSPLNIPNLTNGTTYTITLKALTAAGLSTDSSASSSFVPCDVPSIPLITGITPGNGIATCAFTPGSNNGASLTGYSYSIDNGSSFTTAPAVDASNGSLIIRSLTNGTSYSIAMKQISTAGSSSSSNIVSGIIPYTAPTAPVVTGVTVASTMATVSYTAGSSNGRTVQYHTYTIDGTNYNLVPSTSGSSFSIYGLTDGTQYTIKMKCVDSASSSVDSSGYLFTPGAVASAPIITSIAPGNGILTVSFTNGSLNGGTITGYSASTDGGSTFATITAGDISGTTLIIRSLTNGTAYNVSMKTITNIGASAASLVSSGNVPYGPPGAPTITGVTVSSKTAVIAFTAGVTGGYSILGYKYSLDGTNYTNAPGAATSPITLAGMFTDGSSNTVYLKAYHQYSTSAASSGYTFTTNSVADAPTITGIVAGNTIATLTFLNNNLYGGTVTGYSYSTNGTTYTTLPAVDASNGTIIVRSLTNGTAYTITIKTITSVGSSAASNSKTVTPLAPPAAPTISSVTPGDKQVVVVFTPGATNGATNINYQYSINGGSSFLWCSSITSNTFTIPQLTNDTSYNVIMRTSSDTGYSASSTASATFKPYSVPDAPTISSVTAGNQQLTVVVSNNATNGRPITGYQYSLNGGSFTTATQTSSPIIITGLTNKTQYIVTLRAVNVAGASPNSIPSLPYTPFYIPDAPSVSEINVANQSAIVYVSSSDMNGATILGYRYSLDNSTWTDTSIYNGDTSAFEITGLTNGTSYRVYVKILTDAGVTSSSSISSAFIPCDVPEPPTIVSIVPTSQKAVVTFTDGASNGSAITGYKYSVDGGVTFDYAITDTSPITIYGLTNATSYTLILRAINAAGESVNSTESEPYMPFDVPYAPVVTNIIPGNGCAYVYFDTINANGSPVTSIKYSLGADGILASGLTSPITVPGLVNKTLYGITIQGVNAAGISSASNRINIIPGVPLPPTITSVTALNKSISIEFDAPTTDNGNPITQYMIAFGNSNVYTKAIGTTSPMLVATAIVNGTAYAPKLMAVNKIGNSIASNIGTQVIPFDLPLKPLIVSVVPSYYNNTYAKADVNVTIPIGGSNGRPITAYKYQLSTDTSTWYDITLDASSSFSVTTAVVSKSFTIYNAPMNTAFSIIFSIVNEKGPSPASVASKPATFVFRPPAQPKLTSITAAFEKLTIVFDAPAINGSAITGYKYALNGATTYTTSTSWTSAVSGVKSIITMVITSGVSNNVTYNATVIAVNGAGESVPSAPLAKPTSYVYLPPLSGPTVTAITPGNQTASIVFTAPATRNAPITGYAYKLGNAAPITVNTLTSPIVVTGLTNDVSYNITLAAVTDVGLSAYSAAKLVTPVYKAPEAPVITTLTAGNTTAIVAFTPPLENGSPITGYQYSLNTSTTKYNLTGTTSPLTITGLTNDTSYNVVLYAVNAAGVSLGSKPVLVKPLYTIPSVPVVGAITTTTTGASIVFTPSLANGGTISSYTYSLDGGTTTVVVTKLTSPIVITGLTTKTTYPFIMKATNELGDSAYSVSKPLTTK